ncbi:hypothetical protein F4774DRAFT_381431 [Daldinia eschscholtzii]|nr:hypothetical protein F4774DRAFT_381431 [Daldinia eschscholtzii]
MAHHADLEYRLPDIDTYIPSPDFTRGQELYDTPSDGYRSRSRRQDLRQIYNRGGYDPLTVNAISPTRTAQSLGDGSVSRTDSRRTTTSDLSYDDPERYSLDIHEPPKRFPEKKKGFFKRLFGNDGWTYEILSILVSIGCIAATVALLCIMNGKALSAWNWPIQPNALISIFSVIAKASLMYSISQCISQFKWILFRQEARPMIDLQRFDDASRGSWGSLKFLMGARLTALATSVACLVTIASLAIDPFTQQVIKFSSRQVPSSLETYTQRSSGYDSGIKVNGRTPGKISTGMQAATMMGALGQMSGPPYVCPTGNCTYPTVSTLGIRSICKDVTAGTKMNCPAWPTELNVNSNCTITTPIGDDITIRYAMRGSRTQQFLWGNIFTTTPRQYPIGYQPPPAILFEFSAWNSTGTPGGVNGSTVHECTIELCERTYADLKVTRGERNTPTITTSALQFSHYDIDEMSYHFGAKGTKDGVDVNYTISLADMSAMGTTLLTMFSTSLYPNTTSSGQEGQPGTPTQGLDFANILYLSGNLPELVDHMTDEMTNYMRNINATAVTHVPGEALQQETYIDVHWPWFALPAGLVFLSAMLLLTTIVVNSRRDVKIWKSSVLPFLLHPLHGDDDVIEGGKMEKISRMEDKAEATRLKLGDIAQDEVRFIVQ